MQSRNFPRASRIRSDSVFPPQSARRRLFEVHGTAKKSGHLTLTAFLFLAQNCQPCPTCSPSSVMRTRVSYRRDAICVLARRSTGGASGTSRMLSLWPRLTLLDGPVAQASGARRSHSPSCVLRCIVLFGRDEPIYWISVLKLRIVVLAELAITSCASVWQRPKMKAFHDVLLWVYRIGYKPAVVLTSRRLKDFCGSLASVAYSEDCIDQISCPLHDAHPPPPHHSNDDSGAPLPFRCRSYRS